MDLITDVGILKYLQSKEATRAITEVEKLSGGTANFVWRATVGTPSADIFDGAKTVIVKHAEGYFADCKVIVDKIRMEYENRVLSIVHQAANDDEKIATDRVHVPRVFYFDTLNCVTVQEDGGSAPHLKDYISSLEQAPPKELSTAIGSSLGEFVARLHLYGHRHREQLNRPDQMHSQVALDLSRSVWFDDISNALPRHDFILDEDKAILSAAAAWGCQRLMTEPETLAHGDLWPGNILIKTNVNLQHQHQLEQLCVIDWEWSRYAPAAMDLGQLMAESITLDRYRHPCVEIQTSFLDSYCETYKDKLNVVDLKTAAIHTGCHLVVWIPCRVWFPKAKTKDIISLGTEYMKHAWNENWDWFRKHSSYRVMVEALKL
ncbi:hypothetical protein DFQ26_003740 [Actinomortierella ambigua]|nr:hypothetical protein DFQ26_003740 [Actinomortierella ambigua]